MSEQKTFLKLVYFDEQAAVDFLEGINDGSISETITKEIKKYTDIKADGSIGKGFLSVFKVGLSGNFGRNSNSLIETQISRTVFTQFNNKMNDKDFLNEKLLKFEGMSLAIPKDSLTYFRNITPYLKLFNDLKNVSEDATFQDINHLEMDKILDNAKGYYEFWGTDKEDKVYIVRFNINGMRNNYSLYDLVKMDLSIYGVKVGETDDLNLDFQHEINTMIQEHGENNSEIGIEFREEDAIEPAKVSEQIRKTPIIDVIVAGV